MYSNEIKEKLESENIEIGDKIKAGKQTGKLMPKPKSGDENVIILKLDNGYNVGIQTREIELLEKKENQKTSKQDINQDEDKKDILVLHTGGTIASKVSYEEGGVKPAFKPAELVKMYPKASQEVNIHSEVIAEMLSEDMEPKHWQDIAKKVKEVKDDYDGIIIGHGTDTMQYTGAALSLMLQNINTGVLLVGSQRSSDRPSTDASMNMYCATKFLSETKFQGIGVCMHRTVNDDQCKIMPANKIQKMHTSRRDAFETINSQDIAYVNYENGKIAIKDKEKLNTATKEFEFKPDLDEKVGFIKTRPGMTIEELRDIKNRNYNGLIIEGTGLGHMPVNSFDGYTEHHEKILQTIKEISEDAVVVMTSQCIKGRINMDVYDAGRKIKEVGVLPAKDMHPSTSYVKLMWSLGNSENKEEAEKLFEQNINEEINERSIYQ